MDLKEASKRYLLAKADYEFEIARELEKIIENGLDKIELTESLKEEGWKSITVDKVSRCINDCRCIDATVEINRSVPRVVYFNVNDDTIMLIRFVFS